MSNSTWRVATVQRIVPETHTARTITFALPDEVYHQAGQHYELRLTSETGYQAARLYSATSIPNKQNTLDLTIDYVAGGEVSPYLLEELAVGDRVEIRGPLGGFFVWSPEQTRPVLLVAGGSGVAAMRSILVSHAVSGSKAPMRLVYSVHRYDDIFFKDEFINNPAVTITITGENPPSDWAGSKGRVDAVLFATTLATFPTTPLCYVCGMTPFVEAVSNLLLDAGVPAADIKAERFG